LGYFSYSTIYQLVTFTVTGATQSNPAYLLLRLTGPAQQQYSPVFLGGAPPILIRIALSEHSGGSEKVLHVTLPPGIRLGAGDDPIGFAVGNRGETFRFNWNGGLSGIPSSLSGRDDLLASEFLELQLRGTSTQNSDVRTALDPIYALE
jgi:hypothetical protein